MDKSPRVMCAALRQMAPPHQIFKGRDHSKAMHEAMKVGVICFNCQEGFVLTDGTFVDRVQAMAIAKENGQVYSDYRRHTSLSSYMFLGSSV